MRDLINILEHGRLEHPDVTFTDDKTSVVAHLYSYKSAEFTKLGNNFKRIEELEAEIKELKKQNQEFLRDEVAGSLFAAEDAISTRIVETRSFTFTLSKDPKATVSPKYKDILEALIVDMTPELYARLVELKESMVTTTQKAPSLKVADKRLPDRADEAIGDTIGNFWTAMKDRFSRLWKSIFSWGKEYDAKLDALEKEFANLTAMKEDEFEDSSEMIMDDDNQDYYAQFSERAEELSEKRVSDPTGTYNFNSVLYDENGEEMEVGIRYKASGRYYPSTYTEPAEWPDIDDIKAFDLVTSKEVKFDSDDEDRLYDEVYDDIEENLHLYRR